MIAVNISKRIKTSQGYTSLKVHREFGRGQITQVLGISGAGKTTFMKILAGLIKPEQGSIIVNGKTWFDDSSSVNLPPQQRRVGFVFQDYALFPNMTVEKHLLYGTGEMSYLEELLRLGRMEPYRDHKPKELSGGQQQRLAVLRALSTRPEILLMDEPFSALDKMLRSVLVKELKELIKRSGITCLVVTHDRFDEGEFADDEFQVE